MKSLNDYINEMKNNHKYILCDYVVDSDYDQFLKMNNIIESSQEIYKEYINNNFNNVPLIDIYNINNRSYYLYQNKLYETISRSWDSREFVDKLHKKFNISDVEYVNKRKLTQFSFNINKKELYDNEQLFFSMIHLYNYYVKTMDDIDDDTLQVIMEPYKPKDVTDIIYDKNHGIIYHVTSKDKYEKIIQSEIKPNKINTKVMFRDGRSFFISSNDIKEVRLQLRSIANTSRFKNPMFLRIDLKKFKYKLRFRIDSSASGYNAYFTEEPIPGYCIVNAVENVDEL